MDAAKPIGAIIPGTSGVRALFSGRHRQIQYIGDSSTFRDRFNARLIKIDSNNGWLLFIFISFYFGSPPVKTYAHKRTLLAEKYWRTMGSNPQSLDHRPNALPTELCQPIRST